MQDNLRRTDVTENSVQPLTTEQLQQANAAGDLGNEQGQASFTTGSTTGGGSNYGQGSSHLGAESYRQGDSANAGSNYSNEGGKLGNASTGTSNEGSSSQTAGAGASGIDEDATTYAHISGSGQHEHLAQHDDYKTNTDGERKDLEDGDKRDTSLEMDSGLAKDDTTFASRRASGSWSQDSTGQ